MRFAGGPDLPGRAFLPVQPIGKGDPATVASHHPRLYSRSGAQEAGVQGSTVWVHLRLTWPGGTTVHIGVRSRVLPRAWQATQPQMRKFTFRGFVAGSFCITGRDLKQLLFLIFFANEFLGENALCGPVL